MIQKWYWPTLYNAILRLARNFLETKENIKISTHPFYHVNLDWFSWEWSIKNITVKISPNLYGRMDGSKFWCFPWFSENSLLCIIIRYTVNVHYHNGFKSLGNIEGFLFLFTYESTYTFLQGISLTLVQCQKFHKCLATMQVHKMFRYALSI